MTEMLEEEHKHRALIEETSLRRIKELEMEVNLFLTTQFPSLVQYILAKLQVKK